MLQYYGSFDKGQPGVAQGVEVHSGRERSSTLRSTIGAGAGPGLGLGLGAGNIADGMESMGFQVGCQLGERYSKNRAAFEDTLDIVKFLCKDFWTEVFRKQIDNLKTNHRGVFVLYDSKFRWLRLASVDQNGSSKSVADLLRFPCGLIRGALFTLGIKSVVSADVSSSLPACSFMVKITQNNSKTNA
mmetsp:Transcript_9349/g.17457  ORF Transcript_9349/g.17457 Transcript_9349/m.17457 type:complete len:187 (-) Transcript_9349:1391-1951(-)